MNKKRVLTIVFTGLISIAFTTSVALAGSPAQHRLEGFAIGIGALILTKAIVDHQRHQAAAATADEIYRPAHRPHRRPAGYWDIRKEWVAPQYEKVWNPAHYNRRGKWVPGHWVEIETEPGYWTQKRVWVPYR